MMIDSWGMDCVGIGIVFLPGSANPARVPQVASVALRLSSSAKVMVDVFPLNAASKMNNTISHKSTDFRRRW